MSSYIDIKQYYLYEKDSKKQLWLEGEWLEEHSFSIGQRYDRVIENGVMKLTLSDNGAFVVSRKKQSGDRFVPLLDIINKSLTEAFEGCIAIQLLLRDNEIIVTRSELDRKIERREKGFIEKLVSGNPLNWGSLYHGGGIADSGLHEGFDLSGVASHVKIAVEMVREYLESSCRNNTFWAPDAVRMQSPMELLSFNTGRSVQLDGLMAGVPCTAACGAGRAKHKSLYNDASTPEHNEKAGAQAFYFLDVVNRTNPALAIVENVKEWFNTASFAIVRTVLKMSGYSVSTRSFTGSSFGAIEDRERRIMVVVSRGLEKYVPFNIDSVVPRFQKPEFVQDILDDIPDDSPMWSKNEYLLKKAESDAAAGKGFRLQWIDPKTTPTLGTIGRGYAKKRSTEPFIRQTSNPDFVRQLTRYEHARAKTIPTHLIAGITSETTCHEILGQSVVREWFVCLGISLGKWFKSICEALPAVRPDDFVLVA